MKTGILTKLINKNVRVPPDIRRDYIGASSIGSECWRKIWYSFNDAPAEPLMPIRRRTLEIGKRLESYIIDLLKESGLTIETPNLDNKFLKLYDPELPYFQGHCDGMILNPERILEIKTANDASFKQFVKHGLKKWNIEYFDQIQSYMGMTGIKEAYIIVLNKDTSEIHDELIEFDQDRYDSIKLKARMIFESSSPPPKINASPLWYQCKMCKYSKVCHEVN